MAHVQAGRRGLLRSAAEICLAGALSMVPSQILAQGYPAKPVRVIVPYAAGGAGDIMARVYGQKLAELLAQPFVVDLRPGAAGMLGTAAVAKSAPDGYVVLLGAQAETTVNQNLYSRMSYDPLKDLLPVAMAGILPLVLVVTPALPASSVKEYVALARGRPGELTYGTAGHGTTAHLGMEYLRRAMGIDLVHVTYKGGSEVVTAVAGGHVMSFLSGIPPALPHIQSGRLRAIGISTKDRVHVLADVPTLAEGGIKGFDIANWFGYFVPAGTARDVVARLNSGVQTAIKDPEVRKILERQGIVPAATTPDEFARFTASEAKKYAQIIRDSGIRIE